MVIFGNSGKNARLIGTALLIVTFVAGALAGAAVIRVVNASRPPMARHEPGPPMRGGARRLLLDEQFSKELGLTDAQKAQVKSILDRRDAQAKQMWDSVEPRLHAFGKQVHEEISHVLSAEQQKKLDAAIEKRRATSRQRHGNCGPDSLHAAKKD